MWLRRFLPALLVVVAALAFTASSALATATTTKAQWKVGTKESSVSTLVGGTPFTVTLGKNPTVGETFVMETTIGGSSIPVKTTFGKVTCPGCKITNEDPERPGVAMGTGRLVFSGGSIGPPWNCSIEGGGAETNLLFFEAHYMEGGKWLMKILPTTGEIVMGIQPKGCALAKFPVKGANFAQFTAGTGAFATTQALEFSPSISITAGSSWTVSPSMTMRTTGTLIFKIEESGPFFGVE
jgi:hypothetical protein